MHYKKSILRFEHLKALFNLSNENGVWNNWSLPRNHGPPRLLRWQKLLRRQLLVIHKSDLKGIERKEIDLVQRRPNEVQFSFSQATQLTANMRKNVLCKMREIWSFAPDAKCYIWCDWLFTLPWTRGAPIDQVGLCNFGWSTIGWHLHVKPILSTDLIYLHKSLKISHWPLLLCHERGLSDRPTPSVSPAPLCS